MEYLRILKCAIIMFVFSGFLSAKEVSSQTLTELRQEQAEFEDSLKDESIQRQAILCLKRLKAASAILARNETRKPNHGFPKEFSAADQENSILNMEFAVENLFHGDVFTKTDREYKCAMTVFLTTKLIAERNITDFIVHLIEHSMDGPTQADSFIFLAMRDLHLEKKVEDVKAKIAWRELAQCENCVYRLLALSQLEIFADDNEAIEMISKSLFTDNSTFQLIAMQHLQMRAKPIAQSLAKKYLRFIETLTNSDGNQAIAAKIARSLMN